jgi:hypothetical protein
VLRHGIGSPSLGLSVTGRRLVDMFEEWTLAGDIGPGPNYYFNCDKIHMAKNPPF